MYTVPSKCKRAFSTAASTRFVISLLVAGTLASCTRVAIKQSWREPGAEKTVYHKLLVVGITRDDTVRALFENILTYTLRTHGVEAVASHTLVADLSKADRNQLKKTAQEAGADAVIITRGLSKSVHANVGFSGVAQWETVVGQETTSSGSSATVVMSGLVLVPTETDFELISLQTRVFDTSSEQLVWSALSNVSESGHRADASWDLAALLVKALSTEQLIVINDKDFRQPSF